MTEKSVESITTGACVATGLIAVMVLFVCVKDCASADVDGRVAIKTACYETCAYAVDVRDCLEGCKP